MRYVSAVEIQALHFRVIDTIGGSHGVRDVGLIESAAARPKATFGGKDLYADIYSKAAALGHSLAMNHAFVDGNKRTAVIATARFLHINSFVLSASNPEVVRFVLKVVTQKLDIPEIALWIKKHSKKR